jgi:hypothetical protein
MNAFLVLVILHKNFTEFNTVGSNIFIEFKTVSATVSIKETTFKPFKVTTAHCNLN